MASHAPLGSANCGQNHEHLLHPDLALRRQQRDRYLSSPRSGRPWAPRATGATGSSFGSSPVLRGAQSIQREAAQDDGGGAAQFQRDPEPIAAFHCRSIDGAASGSRTGRQPGPIPKVWPMPGGRVSQCWPDITANRARRAMAVAKRRGGASRTWTRMLLRVCIRHQAVLHALR